MPFDIKCYTKLESKFESMFESKLINEICQYGNLRTISSDKMLIDVGNIVSHMPIVISGSVKVMTEDKNGNDLLLYYLELGETCAVTLNCCTRKAKSTVKAITETESEILFVPVHKMEDWMISYSSWRNYVLDSYNQRMNELVNALDNIVFHSLEERLIKYLEDKAEILKSNLLNISHQDIANDLYTTRVSISRLMRKLESNKMIEQQRNKILLLTKK